jgi:hypothetical protein
MASTCAARGEPPVREFLDALAVRRPIPPAPGCSPALAPSAPVVSAHSPIDRQACVGFASFDRPIAIEVAPWLTLGGGWRSEAGRDSAAASLGGGVEATFGLATFARHSSFVGHDSDRDTPGMHLRAGPWIGFETPLDRVRGEGGLSVTLGPSTADMGGALGTFGLRIGAGYSTTGVLDAVGVLSWGARLVPARRASSWKAQGRTNWCAPGDEPWVAIASVAYLFASVRRSFEPAPASEVVLGVELGWPDGRPR